MLQKRSVYGGTGMITEELRWPCPVLALGLRPLQKTLYKHSFTKQFRAPTPEAGISNLNLLIHAQSESRFPEGRFLI